MIYEFHCCERHKINKLIHKLTTENIEYIHFNTNEGSNISDERVVFVTEPNKIQRYLIYIYKYLDILTFCIIIMVTYFMYKFDSLEMTISTLFIYLIIGNLYKFNSIIFIHLLKRLN